MKKIEKIRHSLAHILAWAVQELYPKTKLGIGSAIENGFYYDFDLSNPISNEKLPKIEEKMKEFIKKNVRFEKKIIGKEEAKKIFKEQPYKLELIQDIPEKIVSIYQSGNFIDLCQGPHIRTTKEIDENAFKLRKIAGAYWKGSEKNKMLTRIYGLAFESEKELKNYLRMQEEIKLRDHRFLGEKLELFRFEKEIGPGLALWLPKGALLKKLIEDFVLNEYLKQGYLLVSTPHIAKLSLWQKSGHLDFYKENMFPAMNLEEIDREEKEKYQLKPMNCPFHLFVFKSKVQ
ncbi:MAG: threonine--tRNA ligase, partial [Minisyncoccales bacterium]